MRFQRGVIEASGYFDREWYLEQNKDVKAAGVDPLTHYLTIGYSENRNPHPAFDTAWYFRTYPDVAASGQNPLVHFVTQGLAEGRLPKRPPSAFKAGVVRSFREIVTTRPARLATAVVVHAFYADLVDELLNACLNVPGADILVSAASSEAAEVAEGWAAAHKDRKVDVRRVPNRGRNVAAYTTTFGRDLLDRYDLFCHLHTKKSLYTGDDKLAWRQHNVHHLLGTPEVVGNVLRLFSENAQIGLCAPLPYPGIPYWAFTWLSNRPGAGVLAQKMGLPIHTSGYVDYPLGNMFWARPNALRQLLDGRFALEDFPEESGQNDGTLAHGIERVPVVVARANGFDWVESDADRGEYIQGNSDKNFWQYRHGVRFEALIAQIDQSETVSFDVFDTLITRTLPDPDDLFLLAERTLDAKYKQATDFAQKRKFVEHQIRAAKQAGDVDFDEIYAAMGNEKVPAALVAEMKALEFDLETRFMRPRARVVEAFRHAVEAGKRVLLVSDMYMSRAQIEHLLATCGISGHREMYLSSELGLRKDTGAMWRHLIEKEDAGASSYLHVGDNEHSDIQLASDKGIRTFHVMSPKNLFLTDPLGLALRDRLEREGQIPLVLGPIIASLFNDPFGVQ